MERELIEDTKDFIESYFSLRECEVSCGNKYECFNHWYGEWGYLAYDDLDSSMCGGRPWSRCWCSNDTDVLAASIYNRMGELEKSQPKIVEPKNYSELLERIIHSQVRLGLNEDGVGKL